MKYSIYIYTAVAAGALLFSACRTQNQTAEVASEKKSPAVQSAGKPLTPAQKYNALKAEWTQKRLSYTKHIEEAEKLLENAEYNDNDKLRIREDIIRWTLNPPWTALGRYDGNLKHTVLVKHANYILNAKEYTTGQKLFAAEKLALYLAGEQRNAEAEALARKMIALPGYKNDNERKRAAFLLADTLRWQDKYDAAKAVLKDARKFNRNDSIYREALLAIQFKRYEEVEGILKDMDRTYQQLTSYNNLRWIPQTPSFRKQVTDFVLDKKNKPEERAGIFFTYCLDNPADYRNIYSTAHEFATEKQLGSWFYKAKLVKLFQMADYPSFCAIMAQLPELSEKFISLNKMYVIATGACGRTAEAAAIAEKFAKNEKISVVDKTRLLAYAAVLHGQDPKNLIEAAGLPVKEKAAVYLSLARQCMLWNKLELAEKYAAVYESFFQTYPDRRLTVKWFDKPILNISDWRAVYSSLEKQYCDIPYKGSMDFVETDVSTGDRGDLSTDKNAAKVKSLEITTLCDKNGLHIFLRAEDENARAIEMGYGRGIGTEMYFAAGLNQPYICMGSNPQKGVTFGFQTTYNNRNHTRLDVSGKSAQQSFHSEVAFSDNDYVLHMFFAWDSFYNKLPANGTDWRYECLAWTPNGGFSWGGSQGIHSASRWGSLRFELTPEQLTAIRKQLLFRYVRSYKMYSSGAGVSENLFEVWGDSEIGDPEFYQTVLKPIETELDFYAAKVKPDMSDEDVNLVYSKAFPRMKGLYHEIDELRRQYMTNRLLLNGK